MPTYPYHALPQARALVNRAWSSLDPAPSSADTQRAVVARVICAMYVLCGGMGFPRGYVTALRSRMEAAGMRAPNPHTIRWYRSKVQDDPGEFLKVRGVDHALLDAIALRYGR